MKIVVVEREKIIREALVSYLEEILSQSQAAILGFPDAESAMEHLEEHSCDLLFVALELCAVSGVELAHFVHEKDPRTQILFLTNNTQKMIRDEGLQEERCISKWFNPSSLKRLLGELDELPPFVDILEEKKRSGFFARLFGNIFPK